MVCWFHRTVSHFFKDQSRIVAKWPLPFLIIPILIASGLSYGIYLKFNLLKDSTHDTINLFLPENMESLQHARRLRYLFPAENGLRDSYSVSQAVAYLTFLDASGTQNVLRDEILSLVRRAVANVKNITVFLGSIPLGWDNLCYKEDGSCLEHPLLSGSGNGVNYERLLYPYMVVNNRSIENSLYFGGVALNRQNIITQAPVLRIPFVLKDDGSPERNYLNFIWQQQFENEVSKINPPSTLLINYKTSLSWPNEIERNGRLVIPFLPPLICLLTIFCALASSTLDWVFSKPWLGICSVINAALAVSSAVGTLFLCGFPFIQMNFIMPFLIMSVSVDNAFLMINSWRMSHPLRSVEDRIADSVSMIAVSVTSAALTDGLSFSVGSISQFSAVRIFCSYCAMAILFNYLYEMSFLVACLTLSGRREAANRHCLTLMKIQPPTNLPNQSRSCFKLFCTGGQDLETSKVIQTRFPTSWLSEFFATAYANFINNFLVKFIITLIYMCYVGVAVWGILNLKLGLDIRNIVPRDSHLITELEIKERLFSRYGGFAYAVIDAPLPYQKPEITNHVLELYATLCNTPYTAPGEFWLVDYQTHSLPAEFDSDGFLRSVEQFVQIPTFKKYKTDLVITPNRTIAASKMLIRLQNATIDKMPKVASVLRRIWKDYGLPGFVYEQSFLLVDQEQSTLANMLQGLPIAVGIVVVLTSIFVRHFLGAFVCGIAILSINLGIVGYLPLWNVRLDIIAMITIVMSIGLSADYVIHMVYHYVSHPGNHDTDQPLLNRALEQVAVPVIQSAVSTLFGIVCLAFVDTYMVEAFIKTVILVMAFGILHSIVFLPVILTVLIPHGGSTHAEVVGHYQRIREYLAITFPRYVDQVRNLRMATYFTKIADYTNGIYATTNARGAVPAVPQKPPRKWPPVPVDESEKYEVSSTSASSDFSEVIPQQLPRDALRMNFHGKPGDLYDFLKSKNLEFDEPDVLYSYKIEDSAAEDCDAVPYYMSTNVPDGQADVPSFEEISRKHRLLARADEIFRKQLEQTYSEFFTVHSSRIKPLSDALAVQQLSPGLGRPIADGLLARGNRTPQVAATSKANVPTRAMASYDTADQQYQEPIGRTNQPKIPPKPNQSGELVQILLNGKLGTRSELSTTLACLRGSYESIAESDQFTVCQMNGQALHGARVASVSQDKEFSTFKGASRGVGKSVDSRESESEGVEII